MSKPVYALVGDEPFLQLQALRELLDSMSKDVDRVDVDGERAELSAVMDDLRSFAMFGGAKLVVVRDADKFISDHREALEKYVANPSSSATLVLRCKSLPSNQKIYKAITKVGQIIQCEPPKQDALPSWILKQAKGVHKLAVVPDAAFMLAEMIGADLGRIDNELAKLALMSDDGKVTTDTITAGVAFQREQEMFKLTDALSSGNITETVRRWRQMLQTDPTSEFRAVTWLTLWLQKLVKVKALAAKKTPAFAIGKELRIWPATQVDGMLKMIQRMGERGIGDALDRLAKLDLRSKSGFGEASTNVEAFLLSLA